MPLVSVITPAFNASLFLHRVVKSVQAQQAVEYEHIIVNDCSTDNSTQILDELAAKDARIKVIHLAENRGVVEARNKAIAEAKGRYLAFLDADDLWMPDKLITQTRFMQLSGAVLSFTDYRFISEDGRKIGRLLRGPNRIGWSMHHMTRYLGCLTIMVDRNKCPSFSFGDVSSEYRAEDFLAWSKLINQFGHAIRCPNDLARYSVVPNSRSSNGTKAAESVWKLYRKLEQVSVLQSLLFFFTYVLFSSWKRWWCAPRFMAADIDGYVAARSYLLKDHDD